MKAFRIFITILVSFSLTICILYIIFVEWPLIIINKRTLSWAAKHFSKKWTGVTLQWSDEQVYLESISIFEKRMTFLLKDVCATAPTEIRTCFKSAHFSLTYQFRNIIPKPVEIGPIRLVGGNVYVNLSHFSTTLAATTPSSREKKKREMPFDVPPWIRGTKLLPIELEIDHFHFENPPHEFEGSFKLSYEQKVLNIKTVTQLVRNKVASGSALVHIKALNSTGFLEGPWTLEGQAGLDLKKTGRISAVATLTQRRMRQFDYQVRGIYHTRFGSGTLKTKGIYRSNRIEGTLQQKISLSKEVLPSNFYKGRFRIPQIELRECPYQYFQTEPTEERGRFDFHCSLYLGLPRWESRNLRTLVRLIELTDRPFFSIETHLSAPFPFNSSKSISQGIQGKIDLTPGRWMGPLVKTSGKMDLDVSIRPTDPEPLNKLNGILRFSAKIPAFHALVQRFSGTPFAIPAPFNTLQGSTQLHLSGDFTLRGGSLLLTGNSKLRSPQETQRIFTDFTGKTWVNTKERPLQVTTNANISLSNVHVGLPKLSVGKLPQIFSDSRITNTQKTAISPLSKPNSTNLHYKIQVLTRQPVQIESNFTSTPIPIDVNLILQDPHVLSGSITIDRFPMILLGGKKEIQRINVTIHTQDFQRIPLGEITVSTSASTTQITAAQLAGQVAGEAATATSRSAPTFQIPFMRLISSLLLGTPLNEVTTEPRASSVPTEPSEPERSELVHIRKRF